jgi:hypothetical protein
MHIERIYLSLFFEHGKKISKFPKSPLTPPQNHDLMAGWGAETSKPQEYTNRKTTLATCRDIKSPYHINWLCSTKVFPGICADTNDIAFFDE